jgi:hypothetical protein
MAIPIHPSPATGYTLAGVGAITDDGRFIPPDPENQDYQAFVDWQVAGHTPTADPGATLSALKSAAESRLDAAADERRQLLMSVGRSTIILNLIRYQEAVDCSVDGTPTGAEYPVINAEVGHNGADLAAVAANVMSERAAFKTALAGIETTHQVGKAAIAAATDAAGVAAALAAVTWP